MRLINKRSDRLPILPFALMALVIFIVVLGVFQGEASDPNDRSYGDFLVPLESFLSRPLIRMDEGAIQGAVKEYYAATSTMALWPREYRHLTKLPQDVKKKVIQERLKRLRDIIGEPLLSRQNYPRLLSTVFDDSDQAFGYSVGALSLKDIRVVGFYKVRVLATSHPSAGIKHELTLEKMAGEWKIIDMRSIGPGG